MPGKDFIDPPGHELGIFGRDGAVLDHVRHTGEGLPEVATVRGSSQERGDCCVQLVELGAEFGSVHVASIGQAVSRLEKLGRRL